MNYYRSDVWRPINDVTIRSQSKNDCDHGILEKLRLRPAKGAATETASSSGGCIRTNNSLDFEMKMNVKNFDIKQRMQKKLDNNWKNCQHLIEEFNDDLHKLQEGYTEPEYIYFKCRNPDNKFISNIRRELTSLYGKFLDAIEPQNQVILERRNEIDDDIQNLNFTGGEHTSI